MSTVKISRQRVKSIIHDEIKSALAVNETIDHKSINSVVGIASKLIAAVDAFKEKAPAAAMNAVTPHLSELQRVLEDMISTPGSYVPRPKKEPQKVTLKAVKGEGRLRETEEGYGEDEGSVGHEPCPFCGSENTEQLEPVPSMAGYGNDAGLTCRDCKKTSWSGPEMGPRPRR